MVSCVCVYAVVWTITPTASCCYASFFGEVKVIFFELHFFSRIRIYCCCCGVYHFILLPKKPKSYHLNSVIFIHENWFFCVSFLTYHAFISQVLINWNHFQFQHFFDIAMVHWTVFILSQWQNFILSQRQNFISYFLRCILSFSYRMSWNTIISSYNFPFQMNRFMMMKYMIIIKKWCEFI